MPSSRNSPAGDEGHIVLVGRYEPVGVFLRSAFDELEERLRFLLAVDYERAVENLVAAVLGIHLREAEYLGIGERAAEFLCKRVEVCLFLGAERQTLCAVVLMDVGNVDNRLRPAVDVEHAAVEAVGIKARVTYFVLLLCIFIL